VERLREVRVVADAGELARAAADEVARAASAAIAEYGRFTIALSGGSTPQRLYRLLADENEPWRARIQWPRVHVFWGDERHVPPDHPESNFGMAHDALLSKVPVSLDHIHRVRAENPDAARAADEYAWTLRSAFDLDGGELPRFDLMLLGLGPEGHTASLFPGSDALRERERLVVAPWVEKLRTFRITMTPPVLNAAALVMVLVSGEEKAEALRAVLEGGREGEREGERDPQRWPAQILDPAGRLLWMIDRAAAGLLSSIS
jgi:6-phosphogluconolactonase